MIVQGGDRPLEALVCAVISITYLDAYARMYNYQHAVLLLSYALSTAYYST